MHLTHFEPGHLVRVEDGGKGSGEGDASIDGFRVGGDTRGDMETGAACAQIHVRKVLIFAFIKL